MWPFNILSVVKNVSLYSCFVGSQWYTFPFIYKEQTWSQVSSLPAGAVEAKETQELIGVSRGLGERKAHTSRKSGMEQVWGTNGIKMGINARLAWNCVFMETGCWAVLSPFTKPFKGKFWNWGQSLIGISLDASSLFWLAPSADTVTVAKFLGHASLSKDRPMADFSITQLPLTKHCHLSKWQKDFRTVIA